MPAFADQLTEDEVWSLVHYVQSLYVDASLERLLQAGLENRARDQARRAIWATVSEAAEHGRLNLATVAVTPSQKGQANHDG